MGAPKRPPRRGFSAVCRNVRVGAFPRCAETSAVRRHVRGAPKRPRCAETSATSGLFRGAPKRPPSVRNVRRGTPADLFGVVPKRTGPGELQRIPGRFEAGGQKFQTGFGNFETDLQVGSNSWESLSGFSVFSWCGGCFWLVGRRVISCAEVVVVGAGGVCGT